uniref:Uncharacterized protein n=1 Tax=Anolis carolinensis TaxID=28377 RepID=A0A803TN40_ANOCA
MAAAVRQELTQLMSSSGSHKDLYIINVHFFCSPINVNSSSWKNKTSPEIKT